MLGSCTPFAGFGEGFTTDVPTPIPRCRSYLGRKPSFLQLDYHYINSIISRPDRRVSLLSPSLPSFQKCRNSRTALLADLLCL